MVKSDRLASKVAEFVKLTNELLPSSARALPLTPVVKVVFPTRVPLLPFPLEAAAVEPLDSSNFR